MLRAGRVLTVCQGDAFEVVGDEARAIDKMLKVRAFFAGLLIEMRGGSDAPVLVGMLREADDSCIGES